jgi:hypothetical protein
VRIVTTPTGAFVVDYATSTCLMLNRTGQKIWSYLEHGASAQSIRSRLGEEFTTVAADVLDADLARFLGTLGTHALIEATE